jgi:hypothetical protein
VPDLFVDAAARLELTQSLERSSITLEDEQPEVVSSGFKISPFKGKIVNEGGDVRIDIPSQVLTA